MLRLRNVVSPRIVVFLFRDCSGTMILGRESFARGYRSWIRIEGPGVNDKDGDLNLTLSSVRLYTQGF